MPRVVCSSCQKELEPGNPQKGTKWVTCTECVLKKSPGADNKKLLGANGRRLQYSRKKRKKRDMTITTDYVMTDGEILVDFKFDMGDIGTFNMALTEEQIDQFAREMREIREGEVKIRIQSW